MADPNFNRAVVSVVPQARVLQITDGGRATPLVVKILDDVQYLEIGRPGTGFNQRLTFAEAVALAAVIKELVKEHGRG